ncbi:hypothetical protein FNV43_RR05036 [Rhamnella rubrinervis]|uniref:Synergin gamma C-terminal domain-containing protein n=1 Tax=Rhamnella rubrinervis TaxID=2594499 RepID=A0A8K0HN66_9ROSA|nr:hypothetical protein FNV43_RR05036 [Rhamnella rubrinervis]
MSCVNSTKSKVHLRSLSPPAPSQIQHEQLLSSSSHNFFPVVVLGSNDAILENNRKALPISLFGDEELETNESSIHQDVSNIPAFLSTNSIKPPSSSLSINDLISSLYSQVEHNTSENHTPTLSENGMYSATKVVELDLVKHDDDFDDDSWEFKDAFTNSQDHDQTSIACVEDSSIKSSTKLQLNDCLEFYSKLKDESSQNSAILSGEEEKAKALGEEFQEVYNQLRQGNMTAKEFQLENLSPRNTCLSELLEVLLEPKFKVLESEYQFSEQLSLAEKDLRSATELSKHASLALKILKLGSVEEQFNYVSVWSRIFSVCALELKHGTSIWEQSVGKNVHSQILLGLDVVLQKISEPIDSDHDRTIKALLESLNYIHDLDALALPNQVFSEKQPTCRLSMLTAGAVPDFALKSFGFLRSEAWPQQTMVCLIVRIAGSWKDEKCNDFKMAIRSRLEFLKLYRQGYSTLAFSSILQALESVFLFRFVILFVGAV